jgi:hypothetical protein
VGAFPVNDHLHAGGGGEDRTGGGGDFTRRGLGQDVLGQCNVRPGHLADQAVVDHGAGSFGGFLAWLEEGDIGAGPGVPVLGEEGGRAEARGDVEVVAARVHDARHLGAVGKAGVLLDGQGIDVGSKEDGGAVPVVQEADDTPAYLVRLITEGLESPRDLGGGLLLRHRELGVLVEVDVELLLPLIYPV